MSKIRITLDPGHSSNYNLGCNGTYYESNAMYDLSLYLTDALEKYGIFEVYNTKATLTDNPSLTDRGNAAINNGSRVFISLHSNAASASSAVYNIVYSSVARAGSQTFAYGLGDAVTAVFKAAGLSSTYRHTTWSKTGTSGSDYYGVIRNSVTSYGVEFTALIEHSFHTNPDACALLDSTEFMQDMAEGIAKYLYDLMQIYYIDDSVTVYDGIAHSTVNVRTGPSTDYQIVGRFSSGTAVKVVALNDGWYKVIYNGASAYCSSNYVNVTATIPAESTVSFPLPGVMESTVTTEVAPVIDGTTTDTTSTDTFGVDLTASTTAKTVNCSVLNVRSGPGTSYSKVGTLSSGAEIDTYSTNVSGWDAFMYDSVLCYVYNSYLDDVATSEWSKATVIATSGLNYRTGPGTSYTKVGAMSTGTVCYVTASGTADWSKMKLSLDDTDFFYCSTTYLQVEEDYVATTTYYDAPLSMNMGVCFGVVNTSSLNVRGGPDTSYTKIGSLTSGYYVVITEQSGEWYKIIYDNSVAYVYASYVDLLYSTGDTCDIALTSANNMCTSVNPAAIPEMGVTEWFNTTLSAYMSSDYGYRTNPLTGEAHTFHAGMDFAASAGKPIYTPVDGVCVANYYSSSYGNIVIMMGLDAVKSYFAHMQSPGIMEVGTFYPAGSIVGYVGTTGNSTGNHVHYEIRLPNYVYQTDGFDPKEYSFPYTINAACYTDSD